ncbi:MAG: DUF305 domain-containing protein [Nocardioides sp.]
MNKTRMLRLAAPMLALGLTLTACSDSGDTDEVSAAHNDQDVAFATDMIPHHAQAVEMADLAADRAGSQDVKDLAENISAAQGPEIEQMSAWLEAWGEEVPDTAGGMEGMEGMEDMPGMMSSADMESLETASGAEFDEMFLSMMVEHHQGAIEMAQTEQSEGENPEAIDLAETIEETQTEEMSSMEDLLASV